jgi:uncharacterized protein
MTGARDGYLEAVDTKIVDNVEASRFEIHAGDTLAGFVTYRAKSDEISLLHTEVSDEFEGQGIGGKLARGVLDTARERSLAVLPFCPFISGWIRRHADYVDLVPESRREEFDL